MASLKLVHQNKQNMFKKQYEIRIKVLVYVALNFLLALNMDTTTNSYTIIAIVLNLDMCTQYHWVTPFMMNSSNMWTCFALLSVEVASDSYKYKLRGKTKIGLRYKILLYDR